MQKLAQEARQAAQEAVDAKEENLKCIHTYALYDQSGWGTVFPLDPVPRLTAGPCHLRGTYLAGRQHCIAYQSG